MFSILSWSSSGLLTLYKLTQPGRGEASGQLAGWFTCWRYLITIMSHFFFYQDFFPRYFLVVVGWVLRCSFTVQLFVFFWREEAEGGAVSTRFIFPPFSCDWSVLNDWKSKIKIMVEPGYDKRVKTWLTHYFLMVQLLLTGTSARWPLEWCSRQYPSLPWSVVGDGLISMNDVISWCPSIVFFKIQ